MAFSQHAGYGSPVGRGERGSRIVSVSHWPSIADMLSQSYCGYEEDGSIGLSSWCHYIYIYIYININTYTYMYYALCFVYIEHSVYHEPISVLINIFMLLQSVS